MFVLQQPRPVAKGNRQQNLLLCSHQLFGSAGHLVSVEQMRLEAASGGLVTFRLHCQCGPRLLVPTVSLSSAVTLKGNHRGERDSR